MNIKCFFGIHYPTTYDRINFNCLYCNSKLTSNNLMHKHKLIFANIKDCKRILDVGSGKMLFGDVNIDIENHKGIDVIVDLNKGKLPFKNNSFDCIILSDVLQQIKNPLEILKESKRIISKNGKIIVTIPNSGNILSKLKFWNQKTVLGVKHINFWNKKEFESIVKNSGLKITEFKQSYYRIGSSFIFELFPEMSFCLFYIIQLDSPKHN